MSIETTFLTLPLYKYLLEITLREPAVLQQLREETMQWSGSQKLLAPEQGQFLALLIKLMQAKNTLDIGTFTGYSTIAVALALPLDGKVITCDIDANATAMANQYFAKAGVANKIQLQLAPALKTLDELLIHHTNYFDFIFIDADKANYLHYYEKALLLLRTGGLVVIDNVLWKGKVIDAANHDSSTEAIRNLNHLISQDKRVEISLVPLGDGLILARKILKEADDLGF